MPKQVRSARGVIIDFDQLKIKEQLASAPAPVEVKARQDFIENRLKRRLKKPLPVDSAEVDAEPVLPEPAESLDESHIEDDVKEEAVKEDAEEEKPTPAPKKKTRVRKKTTTTTENKEEDDNI